MTMQTPLSANTKAILLLTAPLIAGRGSAPRADQKPLTSKQYAPLARRLHEMSREPADLLSAERDEVLEEVLGRMNGALEQARIEYLLGRGMQLSLAVERWRDRSIWVVSRADESYPKRLKDRFGSNAPPILYGCGDRATLNGGGIAVVGSHEVAEDLLGCATAIGRWAAEADRTVITGGCTGVALEARRGALAANGRAIGVLGSDLARAATLRDNRDALIDERLVLISSQDPATRLEERAAAQGSTRVCGIVHAMADALLSLGAPPHRGDLGTERPRIEPPPKATECESCPEQSVIGLPGDQPEQIELPSTSR